MVRVEESGGALKGTIDPKVEAIIGPEVIRAVPRDDLHGYRLVMAVVDYISGMTDHYATELCRKFLGLGH